MALSVVFNSRAADKNAKGEGAGQTSASFSEVDAATKQQIFVVPTSRAEIKPLRTFASLHSLLLVACWALCHLFVNL